MGQYTTRVRFGDLVTGVMPYHQSHKKAEYTYSWRSRMTPYDVGDRLAGTSVGIRLPKRKGNILDVLRDRKRFTEDILTTMGGMGASADALSQRPVDCLTDSGHNFTSVKFVSLQEGNFKLRRRSTGVIQMDRPVFAQSTAQVQMEMQRLPDNFPINANVNWSPGGVERNARLNPVFQNMIPGKEIAQIGETLISLLQGDIPSLLKNWSNLLKTGASLRDISKNAGSEYLNSVFGWQPLVKDIQNAIKVLSTVDGLIYGTAYRRHRIIPWESKLEKSYLTAYSSRYTPVGFGPVWGTDLSQHSYLTTTATYDIRLSTRLVPFARPGLGANKYVDQAEEKLLQLGLWYPALGWDLLPFSWLVDWATSLGSSLTNAYKYGSKPGQVNIDYAWATSCLTVNSVGGFHSQGWKRLGTYTDIYTSGAATSTSVSKTRFPATPFGFGLDLSALNASQVSILVALGLARSR